MPMPKGEISEIESVIDAIESAKHVADNATDTSATSTVSDPTRIFAWHVYDILDTLEGIARQVLDVYEAHHTDPTRDDVTSYVQRIVGEGMIGGSIDFDSPELCAACATDPTLPCSAIDPSECAYSSI